MRSLLLAILTLLTLALGFWTYRQNYDTRAVISEGETISADIRRARARLKMLNAEWDYLNRPDRIEKLVDINFQSLQLQPRRGGQNAVLSDLSDIPTSDLTTSN